MRMSCELDWVVDPEGGNVTVEPLLSGSKWAGLGNLMVDTGSSRSSRSRTILTYHQSNYLALRILLDIKKNFFGGMSLI